MKYNRREFIKISSAFVAQTALFGCGGGGGSSSNNNSNAEEEKYANVRDDIKAYANRNTALLDWANQLQTAIDSKTPEEAKRINSEIIAAFNSIASTSDDLGIDSPVQVIYRKTIDTPERFEAMMNFGKNIGVNASRVCSINDSLAIQSAEAAPSAAYDCVVPFINGIYTKTPLDGLIATQKFVRAVSPNYHNRSVVFFSVYNPFRGWTVDPAKVFAQKIKEYPGVEKDLILKGLLYGLLGHTMPQALQDFFVQYHTDNVKKDGSVIAGDPDLESMITEIRANYSRGQCLLLATHSDGCIYANEIYNSFVTGDNAISKAAIAVLAIASPASYIAGDRSRYFTSSSDLVINLLLKMPGFYALPANIVISYTEKDKSGHFLDTYLDPSLEGCEHIVNAACEILNSLYYPFSTGTWGEGDPGSDF